MSDSVRNFFIRHEIEISEIKYLYHEAKQTIICTTDGRKIPTFLPVKEIYGALRKEEFWNIQKGVVVAARYIINIDDDGVYTVIDGKTFQGRQRSLAEHKRHRMELELGMKHKKNNLPMSLMEKCSLLEESPIAFCIIELVFEESGKGIDFIFRYCNKMMEEVEGVPVSEMINRSFYEVFANGDRKWIIPYADVALNGVKKVLRDFSPEIDKNLIIYCFQPQPGFCACFLVVDEN